MEEQKILIIEDDLSILDLYKRELGQLGYKVFTASTGGTGLTIAKQELPDLILLDIMMPGMDGFSFIHNLRDNAELASIKVIVITNLGTTDLFMEEGKKLGVKKYLIKYKTSLQELIQNVNQVLKSKEV